MCAIFNRIVFLSVFLLQNAPGVQKITVPFSHTHNVGFGNSIHVIGNHTDLGNNDPTKAPRLRWTAGNIWTGQIACEAGATIGFRYIVRSGNSSSYCNPSNFQNLTGTLTLNVPSVPPAHYTGKTILYHSGFSQAFIIYSTGSGWFNQPLQKVGPGRHPGEHLYKITGIGNQGTPIQFVLHDGSGNFDKPPAGEGFGPSGDYYTPLDAFFVQDGQIFNYFPPPVVSPPSISPPITINSTIQSILSRQIRILLPRGYSQNTWRRYPVIYLHDGQNCFSPGGPFGSWDADITTARLTRQGRMREAILVAVNNTTDRISEYVPTGDSIPNQPQGKGASYAQFLIQNVKAFVDANYRTLNDGHNTALIGSSLGGLITTSIGWAHPETFGLLGPMSPSYWAAPNFVSHVVNSPKPQPIKRIFTSWGTQESDTSMWNPGWSMYDTLLSKAFTLNADLKLSIGCGASHNESAWAAQLPNALIFLLNIWDEPNYVAHKNHPPIVLNYHFGNSNNLTFSTLSGFRYQLQRSSNLASWTPIGPPFNETLPWAARSLIDPTPPTTARAFYRIQILDWPISQ